MFSKILSLIFLLFFSLNCSAGWFSVDLQERKVTTSFPKSNFFTEATLKYPEGWYIKSGPHHTLEEAQSFLIGSPLHKSNLACESTMTNPENGDEFLWIMDSGIYFYEDSDVAKNNWEYTANGALAKSLNNVNAKKRKFAENENKKNYDVTFHYKTDDGTECYGRMLFTLAIEDAESGIYYVDTLLGEDKKEIRESIDGFKRECTSVKSDIKN